MVNNGECTAMHPQPSMAHLPTLRPRAPHVQEENDRAEMRWRNFQATKIQAVFGATVVNDERWCHSGATVSC